MKKFFKSLYFTKRLYTAAGIISAFFILGHFFPVFHAVSKVLLLLLGAVFLIDFIMIFNSSKLKLKAKRIAPEKLSNGDYNEISIEIKNHYPFNININIIDEIPFQFQKRDFSIKKKLNSKEEKKISYKLRPVKRGEYSFGKMNIYVTNLIGLVQKRFIFDEGIPVPVYPSFIQMRKYELMAISNRLTEAGIKKIRKISNNKEFDQIREYVQGDDYRTVNWKATARKTKLMVNQYQDEKSQRVYSIIDMGRTMKMPFEEMSLLDYAINSALVISNIAMIKHDKAGLITFSKNIHTIVPADRKNSQMYQIMEALYKQKTDFSESNHDILYSAVKRKINQRSLLLIYTNFEGPVSLERQIKYLKQLTKSHLVVVIFFENTEIKTITKNRPESTEDIYIKTIAEKFAYDKKLIVRELKKNGVHSILTEPKKLTVNTINKYLEFKAKGLI